LLTSGADPLICRWDIPFANLYLLDEGMKRAFLEEVVGRQERGSLLCPDVVSIPRVRKSYVPFPTHARSQLSFITHWSFHCSDSDDSNSSSADDREEEQGGFWCALFHEVITTRTSQFLDLTQFGDAVPPCVAWEDRPRYEPCTRAWALLGLPASDLWPACSIRSCVLFPMLSQTDTDKVVGVMVAGVNPRHELDDNYRYGACAPIVMDL
jgi:hypothetical protein